MDFIKNFDKTKVCVKDGCLELRHKGSNVCAYHDSKRVSCKEPSCIKWPICGGYCREHGGYDWKKTCTVKGCNTLRWKGGRCVKHKDHNDIRVKRHIKKPIVICKIKNCTNRTMQNGICIAHNRKYGLVCIHRVGKTRRCTNACLPGEKRCNTCIAK